MKKTSIALILMLALCALLAGCDAATYTFTGAGNKTTIEVNNAEDGAFAESQWFSVGKGRTAVVESTLDKGELKIDFAEATIYAHEDGPEDVIVGDVIASVTAGAGDGAEFSLEPGEYVLQVTAVGTANGKVVVDIRK